MTTRTQLIVGSTSAFSRVVQRLPLAVIEFGGRPTHPLRPDRDVPP
ncbi:hypothetical protein AB0H73_11590 [Streptomyces olivoreticuli]